jgi:hypothetical protein
MCAAPVRSSCCTRAIRRTRGSTRARAPGIAVDGWFVRQADPQPILESDQQSQAELKLSTHLVAVVTRSTKSALPNAYLALPTVGQPTS